MTLFTPSVVTLCKPQPNCLTFSPSVWTNCLRGQSSYVLLTQPSYCFGVGKILQWSFRYLGGGFLGLSLALLSKTRGFLISLVRRVDNGKVMHFGKILERS